METTIEAIKASPEFQAKLAQSTSPADRANILREAGVAVPTMQEVHEHSKTFLAGAAGAGTMMAAGSLTNPSVLAAVAGVHLSQASLYNTNLRFANLEGANLYGADLFGAHLYFARLSHANLIHASLRYAKLEGANLEGANLTHASVHNTTWGNTTCPNGTNSHDHFHCIGQGGGLPS